MASLFFPVSLPATALYLTVIRNTSVLKCTYPSLWKQGIIATGYIKNIENNTETIHNGHHLITHIIEIGRMIIIRNKSEIEPVSKSL